MKNIKTLFIAGFAALGLVACSGPVEESGNTAETVTITDTVGEVEVPLNPEKVVVMDLGTLDALDYLGVDVLGVPQEASFPEYLSHYGSDEYENAGGLKSADLEAIYEMQPDVIFISGRLSDSYDDLSEIAPVVYLSIDNANYIESFSENMRILGQIFEKEDEVERVLVEMETRMEEVNVAAEESGLTALITMINEENISAFGSESRFGIIHNTLGFAEADTGIEVSQHGQQVSVEYIVEKNPDVLFVIDRQSATGGDATASTILNNDLIDQTVAAQNDQIIFLDSNVWYLVTGGITSTLQMIEEVEAAIK